MNGQVDLLLQLYADDAVALSNTASGMGKIMKEIEKYCNLNELKINIKKTEIIHFRRAGKATSERFVINRDPLRIVKKYNYLGVEFCSSAIGRLATENAILKANQALAVVKRVVSVCKADFWPAHCKLYDSISTTTFSYTVHIWGLRYIDKIEATHTAHLNSYCLFQNVLLTQR